MLGKKNDFVKNKYIIIAVVIAVVVISLSQFILKNRESKDYSEFIEKCDFDKVEAISIKEKEIKTIITDKQIICALWELVKESKPPWHKQKKLYDYSLHLYFNTEDANSVMIYLYKDKDSNEIQIAFYGRRSTITMSGIDENKLVEEIVQLIIEDN
jgi:ATP-dependent Zn protease